jgi:signal transduction histidine kinase
MLEGLDRDWKDGGTRRSITYTHLPPGPYRFRVTAANGDGAWNPNPAVLAFRVDARFYETYWFLAACVLAAGLSGWSILKMRDNQRRAQIQMVADERSRLVREIHDTLLQGFAGVVYLVEAARPGVTEGRASELLDRALTRGVQALTEARQTLSLLRLPSVERGSLPEVITEAGRQVIGGKQISFRVDVTGDIRVFAYQVQHNLYVLAREAITNAVNHAQPKTIALRFRYSAEGLALSIHDDGSGFDPELAAKKNRLGLVGMRERAEQIRGTLSIQSVPGGGTTVEVVVKEKLSGKRMFG